MENDPDKPPLFKSWSGIYFLVIATLAVLVLIFSLISKVYQ
ncbi:MAG TPA: hypothetical protein VKB87_26970 [Myxococcaceae bacterium]|nr:hypothetical protein [Myxococcaceae bacterium]